MAFDRVDLLAACRTHGLVARVVVASVRGSAPREVGASMLVWATGSSGTIGGGALEHQAMQAARQLKTPGKHFLTKHALGPDLGQCCGGAVELFTELFTFEDALNLPDDVMFRGPGEMPLPVSRLKTQYRNAGRVPQPQLIGRWMVEPVQPEQRPLWIWGAGHVGRALVQVLSPLPDLAITWADVDETRFPTSIPDGVDNVSAKRVENLVHYAPLNAEHLMVTYSHDLDLELCHRLLGHGFAFAGLIGSKTKWARFKTRLIDLGHSPSTIARIACPIGTPALGKHPQAIAVGVAADLLARHTGTAHLELESYA
ncbi:MAG: xanthine dehydrogenase accessory protein XdhC [Roseobacter sp.]